MSNTPVQSSAGGAVPPEWVVLVRFTGAFTHSVPPWNGSDERPVVP
jgi:hypothetical protein